MQYGVKILTTNLTSLTTKYGSYQYTVGMNKVPGNGAYIALTGGADTAGIPPTGAIVVYTRHDEADETEVDCLPSGIVCTRRVEISLTPFSDAPVDTKYAAEQHVDKITCRNCYESGPLMYEQNYEHGKLIS